MSVDAVVRVAVASSGQGTIDVHFGQADEFMIYDLDARDNRLVEVRVVQSYYQPGEGDADKREVILRVLADCAALFVERVGDGPRRLLTGAGIEPVDRFARQPVDASLRSWLGVAAS